MKTRRRIIITVLALYAAGIAWGYFRLPWSAVRSLGHDDYFDIAPAVYLSPRMAISPAQLWYLRLALPAPVSPVKRHGVTSDRLVPWVWVRVAWNALVIARAKSAVFTHDRSGITGTDSVYVCLFGAWFPIFSSPLGWQDKEALAAE